MIWKGEGVHGAWIYTPRSPNRFGLHDVVGKRVWFSTDQVGLASKVGGMQPGGWGECPREEGDEVREGKLREARIHKREMILEP